VSESESYTFTAKHRNDLPAHPNDLPAGGAVVFEHDCYMHVMVRLAQDEPEMLANLTATQVRCTELLQQARALRMACKILGIADEVLEQALLEARVKLEERP